MRELLDALYPVNIPPGARLVASYVDGLTQPANFAQLAQLFPDAVHVAISTQGADAQVLDVERGNLTPEQAPAWVQRQWARGQIPYVYCARDTWPAVQAACAAAGVREPLLWEAFWDGVAELRPGVLMKQYSGRPGYDISVVADYLPGIDDEGDGMDPTQAAQLLADVASIKGTLQRVSFGIDPDPANPSPYSVRGEVTLRLRAIDKDTVNVPAVLSTLGSTLASTITASLSAQLGSVPAASITAAVTAAVHDALAAAAAATAPAVSS